MQGRVIDTGFHEIPIELPNGKGYNKSHMLFHHGAHTNRRKNECNNMMILLHRTSIIGFLRKKSNCQLAIRLLWKS